MAKKRDPELTSLHPRTLREAVKELVESPRQKRTKKVHSKRVERPVHIALNT